MWWPTEVIDRGTHFCLLAICARTCASTLVGSCTASVPSTLIRLEILTGGARRHHHQPLLHPITRRVAQVCAQEHGYVCMLGALTFGLRGGHESEADPLLQLLLRLPASLSAQLLLLLLGQVHTQCDRLVSVHWGEEEQCMDGKTSHIKLC